ncbi:sensor histidine kinase [Chromobacterium piscinae]|uniref:sensor histidine kinase n=1 Tax=Chromobacterium piscinae TaxID=686831 RepID=UPI003F80BEB4
MEDKKKLGEHPFTVEARVAIQLGRESISSSLVAIGELVKNSYDADAEEVVINFKGLGTENSSLIITDDGIGMSHSTILSRWFRIGTTYKSELRTTKKDRVYTGAKGLGRLGIDRLCSSLKLYTKTAEDQSIYEVDIDWGKYDQVKNIELDNIKHEIFQISNTSIPETSFPIGIKKQGSQYILTGLKDDWDEEFLIELKKELALLVSPFTSSLGFKIKIDTDGFLPDFDGYITSEHFLEAAEWRMDVKIKPDTTVDYFIYDSKGEKSFSIENIKWAEWLKGGNSHLLCGPLSFTLYFMRNAKSKSIDTNKFKLKDIRSFLKSNQGIRIYRDHFRVKPYGDPSGEGDWLGLAMRRVINPESITMDNWRIGYNQVIGAVFISREQNPALIDQTNREGLTETPAYFQLRSFSLKCIELFEKHIQEKSREEKENSEESEEQSITKSIDENVDAYKAILNEITLIKNQSEDKRTKDRLEYLEKTISKETEKTASIILKVNKLEEEKNTLSNLASLGILSVSFGHETLASISNAIANSELLRIKIHDESFMLPLDVKEYADDRFDQIERSLEYIKIFGNFSLGNVKRDKRTRKIIDLISVIRNVLSSFKIMLEKRKISVTFETNKRESYLIKAYEIDWESIFANLITNSCWALSNTPAEERNIYISLREEDGLCVLNFEDSGCGIEAGAESHIFKATFSTKRNKKGDTIGTGMGLSIVKTFIEEHSLGKISLTNNGKLNGAKFLIFVPLIKMEV